MQQLTSERINHFVLTHYSEEYRAERAILLSPNRGLSGCMYWRIETENETYCLRRWTRKKPDIHRLQFLQAVIWHTTYEGIDFLPLPIETQNHQGFVCFEGDYWELLPWIEGQLGFSDSFFVPASFPILSSEEFDFASSDLSVPILDSLKKNEIFAEHDSTEIDSCGTSDTKIFRIAAMCMTLAQIHEAMSSFPLPDFPTSLSKAIFDKKSRWENYSAFGMRKLEDAISSIALPFRGNALGRLIKVGIQLVREAREWSKHCLNRLESMQNSEVPVQTILGNVSLRHFRFDENGVCGLIDCKEMQVDSVALDLAILLGSVAEPSDPLWAFGLKAYQTIRPLSTLEIALVSIFDRSIPILEGLEYLNNIFIDRIPFTSMQIEEMTCRISNTLSRFERENPNRKIA
ncbi:MAG: hypothetical protein ACRCUY_02800 [Thermoguttaceae bacterium]